MYTKSNSFDLAYKIFSTLQDPDVVSWNTILSGLWGVNGLQFVLEMNRSGVSFDAVSFTLAISFSADLYEVGFGRQIHCLVFRSGFDSDVFVGNSLITMYLRNGCVEDARKVFDEKPNRDLVSWNALISGLTQEGDYGHEAIRVFIEMVSREEFRLDHVSLASVVSACGQERMFDLGCQVHCFAMKVGLDEHVSVANVLMSMYQKTESSDCAVRVFDNMRERNVVSWTTMMSIDGNNAAPLFNSMKLDRVQPNEVTFIALIYSVSPEDSLAIGNMIHGICFKTGILSEVNVSNSLITMYAKLGYTVESRKIFDEMSYKEVISWNSLISGYAQNDQCEEALRAFSSLLTHCMPNQYTFGSILSVITAAQTMSLTYGQQCHCRILKLGLSTNEYVSGALIDMYSKHGSILESQKAFQDTTHRSLISWTAIISAHSKHGDFQAVMRLFEEMLGSGLEPDNITFLAVLMACGGKGRVDIGISIFDTMVSQYKLEPWPEHYSCVVDMLGRAGRLAEAEAMAKRIPLGLGFSAMQSLLGACRFHGEVEMGERVAEALMAMEPKESGAYVLMSNLYAERGEWGMAARVRKEMRERGVKKEVGFSWVDVGMRDEIHCYKFSSGDRSHPHAEEICRVAECLGLDMSELEEDRNSSMGWLSEEVACK
ncbi:uncharacterized protein A4U43_C06F10140 [Asparagus officinalis]|uniref:DYW domain-containing protein n=1 Tax=Asparagus officinalis TaxID=4686 RepID=A0A5P1ERG9_ASPOF|nr:pentatricopeptide repeat-containing protein At4g32430, mitochondrial [Asparagus officinalis]ONK66610.1 uncharacterized protein A4U43_C06F10140 [Asparagus officinalis]